MSTNAFLMAIDGFLKANSAFLMAIAGLFNKYGSLTIY